MKFSLLLRISALGVILLVLLCMVSASSDSTTAENKLLDAHNLIALGTKLKNPLLRLVGFTLLESFKDVCKMKTCGDWSRWSACSVNHKTSFGTRTRSRICGGNNSTMCKSNSVPVTDSQTGLCEGTSCIFGYNMTAGGFCLKVVTLKVNQSMAEEICKTDGAYLVHINSKLKSDDVAAVMTQWPGETIWINGRRASTSSPWEYSYGSKTDAFLNWKSAEPSNGLTELCNVYGVNSNNYWRYDRECVNKYHAMCELIYE